MDKDKLKKLMISYFSDGDQIMSDEDQDELAESEETEKLFGLMCNLAQLKDFGQKLPESEYQERLDTIYDQLIDIVTE